jgi:hypothetical protein
MGEVVRDARDLKSLLFLGLGDTTVTLLNQQGFLLPNTFGGD